ncbi:MAG: glycoside hydrolase family 6 protein [Patescibacteria group bacterium]|nr:glycoside hydrolase family 6 protein [Patescibacteria group bacterium]MDE2116280.1 glycoside hydrolase family 6 protein [Patescibacteria group bacterium]
MKKLLRKVLLATVTLVTTASYVFIGLPTSVVGISNVQPAYAATNSVDIWWPTNGASMTGTQPFKALIDGMPLSNYDMYWQVDNGQLVPMYDSQTDYPHKEAIVNLSNWNWSSNGSYTINFVAKDKSGNVIAQTSVSIEHSTAAPVVNVSASAASIHVWWPTSGTNMIGTQPVKAAINGVPLSNYHMYWSVDNGNPVEMSDNYTDAPHKESSIDFSGWTWKSNGQYALTFTAKDDSGNVIATTNVPIYANASQTSAPQASAPQVATPAPTPASDPAPVAPVTTKSTSTISGTLSTGPLAATKLYVDPSNPATAQAETWAASDPTDSAIMAKLGAEPVAIWLGGWNSNVQSDVTNDMSAAQAENAIPTFVAYNIPGRDCGSYSAGGAEDATSYIAWIKQVSAGIGSGKAFVILEPDALAGIDCLSQSNQTDRLSMLSQAVRIFKANNPNARVYLDAGHAGWVDANTIANRLLEADVADAAGFSLNVSNYGSTGDNETYGAAVSHALASLGASGAHFVIDTSRNGNGSDGEWCNASGRALGANPTLSTGNPLVDALLWIKRPGESDGTCNGGPSAGTWWPSYALGLAKSAGW